MLRYYITDRHSLKGSIPLLLECIQRAVKEGVDFIQIREKDLPARALLELARNAVAIAGSSKTKILVNERADVALAAGADGVHLRSNAVAPEAWRSVLPPKFFIGISCHTTDEVERGSKADLIVFSPVFPSPGKGPAVGLTALSQAAAISRVPLLALGGISEENLDRCLASGAAGIAAIRLFQRFKN